jgi:hypothetical protein
MTCCYNAFFVLIWGSAVLAIPTSVGLLVWLILSFDDVDRHADGRIVTLVVAVLVLLTWTIALRIHSKRVLIRAGAFPGWCAGDVAPHDEIELRQAVLEIVQRYNRMPTIVGAGWGFFLWRRGPERPRVFTHNFTGRIPGTNRWRAGTTIAKVARAYARQGKTFDSHPTMDYISLGAWVACTNHGNGGDTNVGTSGTISEVELLDMRQNTTRVVGVKQARKLFASARVRDYCVLSVGFTPVDNVDLQKKALKIVDAASAAEWLAPGAKLRVLFVGAARSYGLGLRWQAPYRQTSHKDPHFCSRFCMFFQVDVCSSIGGCHEKLDAYEGLTTLYEANRWMPTVWPWMTLSVVLSRTRNFEIFFKLPEALNGQLLWKLLEASIAMHKTHGGRSEVRYWKLSPDTSISWDISMRHGFSAPFELLYNVMGVRDIALHNGKYTALDPSPCMRYTAYELGTDEEGSGPLRFL